MIAEQGEIILSRFFEPFVLSAPHPILRRAVAYFFNEWFNQPIGLCPPPECIFKYESLLCCCRDVLTQQLDEGWLKMLDENYIQNISPVSGRLPSSLGRGTVLRNTHYSATVTLVSFAVLLMLLFAVTPAAADTLPTVSEYGYIDDGYIPPESDQDIDITALGKSLPATYWIQNLSLQHQEEYGTCWAFAATTSASSNLMMKGLPYVNFSKHQLAYFTYHRDNITNMTPIAGLGGLKGDMIIPDYTAKYPDYMRLGGHQTTATFTLATWTGLVDETSSPYSEVNTDQGLPTNLAIDADTYILTNASWVNILDGNEVKYMLSTQGAAAVNINVSDKYMNISDDQWPALYCNDGSAANHAVTLIGWDNNFAAGNFTSPPEKNGAWLIQNSWGVCNKSYIWVSYCDKVLREAYFYDVVPKETYEKNYQYDGGVSRYAWNYPGYSSVAMVNVFTASGSDRIDAISFFTSNSDVNYRIAVYTDLTNPSDPTSGVLRTYQSGKLQFAGYATIPLNEPVELIKDQTFSVVVILSKESRKADEEVEIVVDTTYETSENSFHLEAYTDRSQTYAESGQSFISLDEVSWYDLSTDGKTNVRVKAFTNPYVPASSGNAIKEQSVPVTDDPIFSGWYQDEDYPDAWGVAEDIDGDTTQYVTWAGAGTAPEAAANVQPAITQASSPICGVLAGLLAACVLLRRKE